MNCQDLLDQLGDYLDRDAALEICRAIEGHMERCSDCRLVVDRTRKTILIYQSDREVPMPPAVERSLQEVLAREYGKPTTD